jgi:O-acetyl-ADP-ribose deacetylase
LLASCYQTSLALAKEKMIITVAFPSISTGIFGFPKDLAALIAVNETRRFLNINDLPEKVIFVTFDEDNYDMYMKLMDQ